MTFFPWLWKPLVCGHLLLCKCSEQLLIVSYPEVGLLLSWPGNTYSVLQQLSASIWPNNARMILRYWALQVEDTVVITLTVSKCHS